MLSAPNGVCLLSPSHGVCLLSPTLRVKTGVDGATPSSPSFQPRLRLSIPWPQQLEKEETAPSWRPTMHPTLTPTRCERLMHGGIFPLLVSVLVLLAAVIPKRPVHDAWGYGPARRVCTGASRCRHPQRPVHDAKNRMPRSK